MTPTADATWAADILEELPPLLTVFERDGADALDEEARARVLVLVGRAAQLAHIGDALDLLVARARPLVATIARTAPLPPTEPLLDEIVAALASDDTPFGLLFDALLDGDDWLTAQGLLARLGVHLPDHASDAAAERFADAASRLVSAAARVAPLAEWASARIKGLEDRADGTAAWRALRALWRAVAEAQTVESQARNRPAPAAPAVASIYYLDDVATATVGYARGASLPKAKEPIEIARWGTSRLVLTAGGPRLAHAILQVDGRAPEQTVGAWRNGEPLLLQRDEFGAEVVDALPGRYRVAINHENVEFELRERREPGSG